MAAKYTGNYTNEATKVLKHSERLECQVTKDGTIYVSNGYLILKVDPMEYASLVQPVTCCEAGNWRIDSAGKHERSVDWEDLFRSLSSAKNAATLEACPMVFSPERGREIVGYYSAAADFAAIYNRSYMAAISPSAEFKAINACSAAVAYSSGEPFALVLPIKPVTNICRAVKAYFVDSNDTAKRIEKAAADKMHDQLAAYDNELAQARSELEALREQAVKQAEELESLRKVQAVQEAKPVENETPEAIAARFSALPGVTTVVKGAQTSTPVIWISGEVQQNAEAIKAAGARWSAKRSAYYFRVA